MTCIYNGFDPDDLAALRSESPAHTKLRIVYTGTLWKLTSIAPLVRAIQLLAQTAPQRIADVELVVAGRRTPQQEAVLAELRDTPVSVVCQDYLPHRQSLQLATAADMLLLLLDDQPGAERVVPAKLFEYLALDRPILAIGPVGEASELLRRHSQSASFRPADVEPIARWLVKQLDTMPELKLPANTNAQTSAAPRHLAQFSRPSLTGDLAQLLSNTVPYARR